MNRLSLAIWMAFMAGNTCAAGLPDTSPQHDPATDSAQPEHSSLDEDGTPAQDAPAYRAEGARWVASPKVATTFDPVKVVGQRLFPYQEGMVMTEEYIDDQVRGNSDIGTLLRINPHVQFDNNASSSRNMGEIRPADISINGGLFYQNAFLLDGAGFTNDLDPASNNPNHFTDPPSHTQGIALDTELIGSLTVYDSNVPASYGGFNGGVIDAESRKAKDVFSGKVSYRMSRSVWNEIHVHEDFRETFEESSAPANQPAYDKYKLNVMLEGRTSNGVGLIGNISRTRSEIPLRGQSGGNVSEHDDATKEQVRENTSLSLRADWANDNGLALSASFTHAPTDERYFIANVKDSWFDLKQGGPLLSLRANLDRGAWSLQNTLSYSDLDSSRRSDLNYWYSWRWSEDKNWGTSTTGPSTEGNWGNVDQTNRNVAYKMAARRDPILFGKIEHRLEFGLEVSDRKATYHRLNDHYTYISPAETTTCTDANGVVDTAACSLSPAPSYDGAGQYLTRFTTYLAGRFAAEQRMLSVFAQDDLRMGNWSFRPGVRVDRDSLSKQTTVAPRFAMSWDILGNESSLLTGGINRYYGRNMFAYKLREGRESLSSLQTRGSDLVWSAPERDTVGTRFDELDVPYSDEWTIGLNQKMGDLSANFKYVRRDNRDEVLRVRLPSDDDSGYYSANVYEYKNLGRSKSDTYTLSLDTGTPWRWGASSTSAQIALDHTDVRRNYTDYGDSYSDDFNEIVRYEGDIMPRRQLPADSFNRPWTARLATQTRFDWGLRWSNFLRYRAGYLGVRSVGTEVYQGDPIDVLENYDYPNTWTWDTVLEYAFSVARNDEAYVRVEVTNLLDHSNVQEGTGSGTYYEPGRAYWVEFGYRF